MFLGCQDFQINQCIPTTADASKHAFNTYSKGMKGGVLGAWILFISWLQNADSTKKVGCLPVRPWQSDAFPTICKCTPLGSRWACWLYLLVSSITTAFWSRLLNPPRLTSTARNREKRRALSAGTRQICTQWWVVGHIPLFYSTYFRSFIPHSPPKKKVSSLITPVFGENRTRNNAFVIISICNGERCLTQEHMINVCGRLLYDIFITGLHIKNILLCESKFTGIHEESKGREFSELFYWLWFVAAYKDSYLP